MSKNITEAATALIARDFDLDFKGQSFSDEELFNILADHVAYLIEYKLDFLLSLMYRLDIAEQKVNAVLSPAHHESANVALARLIIERQKQRIHTKATYKPEEGNDWMEWNFD